MSEPRLARLRRTDSGAALLQKVDGDGGRRLHALTEISRLVTLGIEEPAILRHLAEAVARLLAAPYAGLWMLDEATGDLVVVATAAPLGPAIEPGLRRPAGCDSLNQVVLASGRLYQTADVEAHPNWINHSMTRRYGLRT
ncbi:MAG: hypothetical protein M3O34_17765 [Chloroflexota bacterium]|nr:hypothetical protein [Chloroflexota bacterium]